MNQRTAIPQAVQARAAAALAALLTEHLDAPLVGWSVKTDLPGIPDLVGQVRAEATDPRADVSAWARILGVEVVENAKHLRATGARWTDVRTTADSGGVRIEVWAMVDQIPAQAVAA